jgi:hypothetical protein
MIFYRETPKKYTHILAFLNNFSRIEEYKAIYQKKLCFTEAIKVQQ